MSAAAAAPPDNRLVEPIGAVLERAPAGWRDVIDAWRDSPAGRALVAFVAARQAEGATIFPARVFAALERTPRDAVRVVIVGQDPYHGAGQAEGMAFSVPPGQPIPPSLRNIDREIERDLALPRPRHGHLGAWAARGVLLLNTSLTVEEARAGAHAKRGWEALADALIGATARDPGDKVYLLWGAHAQARRAVVEAAGGGRHLILQANHPSPLSATRPPVPFVGCGHFGRASRFLAERRPGEPAMDWSR